MSYNLKTLAKIWRDGNNRGDKVAITALGKYGNYAIPVPQGLIVPYNDTSVPDGWSRFSSADDKFIIGAGSTYSVGDSTSGSNFSVNSTTTGSHTGPTFVQKWDLSTGPYPEGNQSIATGSHNHTYSGNYKPDSQVLLLIKANETLTELPVNSIALTHTNTEPTGTTSCFTDNRVLGCGSSITTISKGVYDDSISTTGSHVHSNNTHGEWVGSGVIKGYNSGTGNHTHTMSSLVIASSIKRLRMRAWTNAVSTFNIESQIIGMYESLTPPSGWVLCDGANDTPDLRDYFVEFNDGNNTGTTNGNNTLSFTSQGTLSYTNWDHNHRAANYYDPGDSANVSHGYGASSGHSHSTNQVSPLGFIPNYYALAFIMKS